MSARRLRQRPQLDLDGRRLASGRSKHGLSPAEVAAMLREQDGRCALCRTWEFGPNGPVIDHDHDLARQHGHSVHIGCARCVRAVLCSSCNTLLGAAKDDPDLLREAARFLDAWRSHVAAGAR